MIKVLKEKGYKIEEPESRFLKVIFSDKKNVLLENFWKNSLVESWTDENNLNNLGKFEENDSGHFWINGGIRKFEFRYKEKWLECNEDMPVRFLR